MNFKSGAFKAGGVMLFLGFIMVFGNGLAEHGGLPDEFEGESNAEAVARKRSRGTLSDPRAANH